LERLCGSKDEVSQLRSILECRFLLNFYKGALALNPVVREISLSHLKEHETELRQAHSSAADYHMRHFKAKQIVGSQSKLGESFAELRYHLVQAGREAELALIGQRFTEHLKQEMISGSPVPTDREELDERIAVLTVLLGEGGAKGLEYHLARCLGTRGKPGDLKLAAAHAARATGVGAPVASWYLRAELENRADCLDAAMRTIYEAIHKVSGDDSLFSLFQLGAELLSRAGRGDEAVTLLREGIKVIPPDKNAFSLYQSCAQILARAGKTDDAVTLLREGIKVIPPENNAYSLYQSCGEILARADKTDDAATLLREGIKRTFH
jgi:tetratricopeptide (TPR) repeat protein